MNKGKISILHDEPTEEREFFEAFFHALEDYILILDATGEIIDANKAIARKLGYTFTELYNMNVLLLYPPERIAEIQGIVQGMFERGISLCSIPLYTKTGERIPVETKVVKGKLKGRDVLFAISKDNSRIDEQVKNVLNSWPILAWLNDEEVEKQRYLGGSELWLSLATSCAQIALWEWFVPNGKVNFNDQWTPITGYTPGELAPISIDTWRSLTHPEDLKKSDKLLAKCFSGEVGYYECEIRMKHKSGEWVWVLGRGKVIEWDEDKKPIRMVGIHINITSQNADSLWGGLPLSFSGRMRKVGLLSMCLPMYIKF